jgi:hypothetical protein
MAMNEKSTAQAPNAKYPVARYSKFTVYAAATSTVALSADDGSTFSATVAIPAVGYLTITDLATHIQVNAAFRVIGEVSIAAS